VLLAEGIIVSLRSHLVLERVKNSLSCLGSHPNFSGNPPTCPLAEGKVDVDRRGVGNGELEIEDEQDEIGS
jgi:hypothetical protein